VFRGIARRYDRLNAILSLGRDQSWRARAVAHLPAGRVLDLGGGTGAANDLFAGMDLVALDPAESMLDLNPSPKRVVAIGERLPFADASFDGVFSAYVFRNLVSIPRTLDEVARVLRPGGALAVVDLGRPDRAWLQPVHRVGTAVTLPLAGMTVGAREEYTYLHRSLDKLPPPEELFADAPLNLEVTWRMGPLGFVYGAVLRKAA
jgi:demethylmenaquinone methyltransferase/2-methoxy-6-polyprenyl-1,4-benzoquinol methylase